MKALFGFVQTACAVGGFISLLGGRWLWAGVAWAIALLVGVLGNIAVRATEGISETGRDALVSIAEAARAIDCSDYATGASRAAAAVSDARWGGDKFILVLALTIQCVALCGQGNFDKARNVLSEAEAGMHKLPNALAAESIDLLVLQNTLRDELDNELPDANFLMAEVRDVFDEITDH